MYVQAQVCLSDSLKPEYGLPRRSSYSNSNNPLPWSHMENPSHPGFLLPELLKHKCFANITVHGPSLAVVFVLGFAVRAAGATVGDCTPGGTQACPRCMGMLREGQGGEMPLPKPMQKLSTMLGWVEAEVLLSLIEY